MNRIHNAWVDDSLTTHPIILSKLICKSLLDFTKKYYRVDGLHDRIGPVGKCPFEADARSLSPVPPWSAYWYFVRYISQRNQSHYWYTGMFDSYSLFQDMLNHPSNYLNGTAPLNTTGAVKSCVYQLNEATSDTGNCTIAQGSDRDSFLWYV